MGNKKNPNSKDANGDHFFFKDSQPDIKKSTFKEKNKNDNHKIDKIEEKPEEGSEGL
jgi:hypothetical protein